MGKKTKKLNRTQEEDVTNSHTTNTVPNNSTDTVTKSKKKNRKRDLNGAIIQDASVQNKTEEISESNTLGNNTTIKTKKEKKKKHTKRHEEELCEEVQNDTVCNNLNEDQLDVPRKKKKKGKLLDEEGKPKIETCVEIEDNKSQTDSKERKSRNSSLNESNIEKEKAPKIQDEDTKHKKKKGKNKAKRGAPVLNNEESQVTEEDIDRFIDELDEEDNKQYEDWVKLLDARLSKKQHTD